MRLRITPEDKVDLHTGIVAVVAATIVCCMMALAFMWVFQTPKVLSACSKYGWNEEGTMPFTHQHCVDRQYPFTMHNPPEIKL